MMDSNLFSPLTIRDVTFRNRIVVSPMCQYSCQDGFASDWHLVHLGSRAVGGAAIVFTEATAVEARGRISPRDLGIWKDEHVERLARVAEFVRGQGAVAGIQLAHAGRKASSNVPWENRGAAIAPSDGGWRTVAPSAIPFRKEDPAPDELSKREIAGIVEAFTAAARRALIAGFQVIELHGAHGYLINEFLSPLSNRRTDEYGESWENRIRFALEITEAVREVWPHSLPLFFRISATDWMRDGWQVTDSVELARRLKPLGVDLMDCSSGGIVPNAKIEVGPGYQVPFAQTVRREAEIRTGAVGMITQPEQADEIIRSECADLVALAREILREPYWPLHASRVLSHAAPPPIQYARAY